MLNSSKNATRGIFAMDATSTRVFFLTMLMTVHSRGAVLVLSKAGPTLFHLPLA